MGMKMVQRRECFSFLMVTLLQLISCSTADCPNDWQIWTSTSNPEVQKCFKFASSIGTYSEVRAFCQNNGGEIVNIDSSEENDFIFEQTLQMSSSGYLGYNSFWLGADSLATSGGYYKFVNNEYNGYDPTHWWNPATSTGLGYWNWWPAEPAHVGAEHCAVMQATYSKQWSDEDCESTIFVRSAACQLVESGGATTESTTKATTTRQSTIASTTRQSTIASTTRQSTIASTTRQSTIASTTRLPTTTLQSTQRTTEPSNPPNSEFLFPVAGEFIRKGQVCLLNFSLETITTANLNRCAGLCVRHEACVSFSYISLSQENQCTLYSVSKDSEHASITYEPSPGMNCLYYERRLEEF